MYCLLNIASSIQLKFKLSAQALIIVGQSNEDCTDRFFLTASFRSGYTADGNAYITFEFNSYSLCHCFHNFFTHRAFVLKHNFRNSQQVLFYLVGITDYTAQKIGRTAGSSG